MTTMQLIHPQWLLIKSGLKTIEIRLNDAKRQALQVGDIVNFIDLTTGQQLTTQLIDITRFASFESLLSEYTAVQVGSAPGNAGNTDGSRNANVVFPRPSCAIGRRRLAGPSLNRTITG